MNKSREVPVRIIIRRKGHGAAHGGAWKVALADFMTAMFALFLVLWLVNQSTDVKSAIAGYFNDPLGRAHEFGSSIVPGAGAPRAPNRVLSQEDVMSMRRDQLNDFAKKLKSRLEGSPDLSTVRSHVQIQLTKDGLRIELLEDSSGVFFETGVAIPTASGQDVLELLGSELGTLPNTVRIEGHTDAWPYRGSPKYTNWELSADRANAARRIMAGSGLKPSQISGVAGFADRDPRYPQDPYSPRNRRVTITILLQGAASADSIPPPPPERR